MKPINLKTFLSSLPNDALRIEMIDGPLPYIGVTLNGEPSKYYGHWFYLPRKDVSRLIKALQKCLKANKKYKGKK